jgi:hypothetical protein
LHPWRVADDQVYLNGQSEILANVLVEVEFTLLVGGQVFFEVEIRQIKLDCGLSISQPEYLAVHFRSFDRLANVVY